MNIVFRCDPALRDTLPRPLPALQALPDWLREMPGAAFSELHGREVRTVKQCPPFVDAMRHGFVMRLPCDVSVADGRFSWDWDLPPLAGETQPRSPLSFHAPAQVAGSPLAAGDGRALIKFNSFWTIELGARLFAVRHASRQSRRPAVPHADRPGRFRPLQRRRHPVSRRLDRRAISRACCRRERRWRNVSRSPASRCR